MSFKLFYYIKRFSYNALPAMYFARNYKRLKAFESKCDKKELALRLDYYIKQKASFVLPDSAQKNGALKRTKGTDYYLDLKDFLNHFPKDFSFVHHFGDNTEIKQVPTLIKARKLNVNNEKSILFKLNKNRHFQWVNDRKKYSEKENKLVWRGGAYLPLRKGFVKLFYNHLKCNVGQTNSPSEEVPWQKPYMSISEQLEYKFIFCPEGNDVATNLKWVMSSNSLCFMPKPTCETWFMEGVLEPGVHYVEIAPDYSDLEEKIDYYSTHISEAEVIIKNAHKHVSRFQDKDMEDLLCLKVLESYFIQSGQLKV
jgi:hypothetical protein